LYDKISLVVIAIFYFTLLKKKIRVYLLKRRLTALILEVLVILKNC